MLDISIVRKCQLCARKVDLRIKLFFDPLLKTFRPLLTFFFASLTQAEKIRRFFFPPFFFFFLNSLLYCTLIFTTEILSDDNGKVLANISIKLRACILLPRGLYPSPTPPLPPFPLFYHCFTLSAHLNFMIFV